MNQMTLTGCWPWLWSTWLFKTPGGEIISPGYGFSGMVTAGWKPVPASLSILIGGQPGQKRAVLAQPGEVSIKKGSKIKMYKLTDKRRVFVEYYLRTWNATEAARLAGYAFPNTLGTNLMQAPAVRERIEARLIELSQETNQILAERASQAVSIFRMGRRERKSRNIQ
jgi:hypothetical protein